MTNAMRFNSYFGSSRMTDRKGGQCPLAQVGVQRPPSQKFIPFDFLIHGLIPLSLFLILPFLIV